jgi:hypothetical protein
LLLLLLSLHPLLLLLPPPSLIFIFPRFAGKLAVQDDEENNVQLVPPKSGQLPTVNLGEAKSSLLIDPVINLGKLLWLSN